VHLRQQSVIGPAHDDLESIVNTRALVTRPH
jgi:hypothetical protein